MNSDFKKNTGILIILIFFYSIGLIQLSQCRHIDGDEGYYASSVGLVAEGKTVYSDFIYPQAPLLPYIYSIVHFIKASLASLRIFSALLSVLMVSLWGVFLLKQYPHTPAVLFMAMLLLILDPYLASWNVVVKTYVLSNFFITLILLLLFFAFRTDRKRYYILSGICCSLLISIRALYGPVVFVILGFLFLRDLFEVNRNIKASFRFIAGLAAGSIPLIYFFIINPKGFIFNNITYHAIRSYTPGLKAHFFYAGKFFLQTIFHCPYLLLIIGLSLTGLLFSRKPEKLFSFRFLLFIISGIFIISSSYPFPLFEQYYLAALAPFLFPFVSSGVSVIHRHIHKFAWLLLFIAILISIKEVQKESFRHPQNSVWTLKTYQSVSQYIVQNTKPDDIVLSFWTGYIYESGRQYLPKFESHTGIRISPKLSDKQRSDYRIISNKEIFSAIKNKVPSAVITGVWMRQFHKNLSEHEYEQFYRSLDNNYKLSKQIDTAFIYLRRE